MLPDVYFLQKVHVFPLGSVVFCFFPFSLTNKLQRVCSIVTCFVVLEQVRRGMAERQAARTWQTHLR